MKRIYLVLVPFFINACAPRFDSNELMLAAQIKTFAEIGMDKCSTDPKLALTTGHGDIVLSAHLMTNLSSSLPDNEDTAIIATELLKMAKGMAISEKPSRVFCEEKFRNIIGGTDRLLKVIGRKGVE